MTNNSPLHINPSYSDQKQNYQDNRSQNSPQLNCINLIPQQYQPKSHAHQSHPKPTQKALFHQPSLNHEYIFPKNQETQCGKLPLQFTKTAEQFRECIRIKQQQVIMLLDEIQRLHNQCFKIQQIKNIQIKSINQHHNQSLAFQVQNILKCYQNHIQILQLYINQLKQTIQFQNYQYQILQNQTKLQNNTLSIQLKQLKNSIKHQNTNKQIQIKQFTQKNKQIINTSSNKQIQRLNSISLIKLQNKVKKLKYQVIKKNNQIQFVIKKNVVHLQQYQKSIDYLQNQKKKLVQEICFIQVSRKQNMWKEKSKNKGLCEIEVKNVQNKGENQKEGLKKEINKLLTLCKAKSEEIHKLCNRIDKIKEGYALQKEKNQKLVEELRERIAKLELDNTQGFELLKIKMSQFHQTNIKTLGQHYQNQFALLTKQINQLQNQREQDRQKLHKNIQQNDTLRKSFEIQVAKYESKIQQYKIKLTSAHLQYKQQITSIETKIQLTSQTLLRETQQKQKFIELFQKEKQQFQQRIQEKDKEIGDAYENINKLKDIHNEEITQLKTEIDGLRSNLTERTNQLQDISKTLQQQYENKITKFQAEHYQALNDAFIKQSTSLKDHIQHLQKQIIAKTKQLQLLQQQNTSLKQQKKLRIGFTQSNQLQQLVTIEDQKQQLKMMINSNQITMKDYYQYKLFTKQKYINTLEVSLKLKQNDVRQLSVKYNQLQKRIKEILEAQERLSQFQKKIINIGLNQNVLKNISQLFTKQRK